MKKWKSKGLVGLVVGIFLALPALAQVVNINAPIYIGGCYAAPTDGGGKG